MRDKQKRREGVRPSGPIDPAIAEESIIGFVLCFPKRFFQVAVIRKAHFIDEKRGDTWEAIRGLIELHGSGLTPALLAEQMARRGVCNPAQAADLLVTYQDRARDAADGENAGSVYTSQMLDQALRRKAKSIAREINETAEAAISTDELRNDVQIQVFDLMQFETAGNDQPLELVLDQEIQRLDRQEAGEPQGILSGISDLDELWNGCRPGDFVVVAARPSIGKTSLGTQLAIEWAVRQKRPGGIWSLEMSKASLCQRMGCQYAQLDLHNVIRNKFKDEERARYIDGLRTLQTAVREDRLIIMDSKRLDGRIMPKSILDIVAEVRYWRNRRQLDWVMVDYIQLIAGIKKVGESREREVASVSQLLKQLAQELEIPVIGLCQIKRPHKDHEKKRPKIHELRESGSIEQDADIVLMIHNWDNVRQDDNEGRLTRASREHCELILGKQRNGRTGVVKVDFVTASGLFETSTGFSSGGIDAAPKDNNEPGW